MGDPVTMAIVGGSAIAGSTYLGGRQQRNAYKAESAQMETEKKAIETNAAISQEERLRKLKNVIALQNATFAMGGQTAGVGTAGAIQAESMSNANREARLQNLQTKISKNAIDYNIWSAKKASKLAMGTQVLNTGLNLASKAAAAYFSGYFSGAGEGAGTESGGQK